ncbi:MAG: FIST C-terminal domain-containing protein [Anaerolineae bacterium]|nr:FIST C-terminal domain-containing protein [Anaerolineae bacterium]
MGQVSVGMAQGFDSKEVARNAIQQAILKMGTGRPSFAMAFISREFNISDVSSTLAGFLGNVPLWGFSTHFPLTVEGEQDRSVILVLVSGKSLEIGSQLILPSELDRDDSFTLSSKDYSLFILAGDGARGLSESTLNNLRQLNLPVLGCLASGDFLQGFTTQITSGRSVAGGLAVLGLNGAFKVGVGLGHGWQEIGFTHQIGRIQARTLMEMDGLSPAAIYEKIFGYSASQWSSAALSEIVPLYPLGIEIFPGSSDLFVRTPLNVQADGSFVLNASVAEGQMAHIMVGNIDSNLEAVRQAIKAAEKEILFMRPLLSLVLVDYAWHLLMGERIKEVMGLVQAVQPDVPVVGAYTMGHIYSSEGGSMPQVLNQNIMVLMIAEKP